jgi:hypothetical protein
MLLVQKTLIVGAPGKGICNVLSFYTILMVPSSVFTATIIDERSPSDIFSHDKTIRHRRRALTNQSGGLSLFVHPPSETVQEPSSWTSVTVSHHSCSGP